MKTISNKQIDDALIGRITCEKKQSKVWRYNWLTARMIGEL